jgi:cytochrome c biogenesis protein CcdA/thiol-disulfide isomerase/thioredoxin
MDITLLITSLLAGMLTILAPCVLPVLPVVLAGSITEKQKWYPYVVTLSLALSVVLFTVLLKASTALIDIPSSFWKGLSGGILIALGLVYLFPHAWVWIAGKLGLGKSGVSLDHAQDIWSPVLRAIATGWALGPVFSTCSPTYTLLLATVFPVSFAAGIGYTLIYALGLAIMLTLIAIGGRSIIVRFRGIASENWWFKRSLGIVFVLIGLAIISGLDKKVETWVLDRFDVPALEEGVLQKLIPKKDIIPEVDASAEKAMVDPGEESEATPVSQEPSNTTPSEIPVSLETKSMKTIAWNDTTLPEEKQLPTEISLAIDTPFPAPELRGLTNWINSDPLTLANLKWKVVIIDFWTFGCINCQRTRPYVNSWYEKYRDQWLVVLGLHAPEFAYEKKYENVKAAVEKYAIEYPVALDQDFSTWKAYENQYWPALYFIGRDGQLYHMHFGEGDYEKSEEVIRYLLSI